MWSRFAELAKSLAQDLAQPEGVDDEDDDEYEGDHGYYEEEQEGSCCGGAAPPQQYYQEGEEGEQQYDEQYTYDEGGEQPYSYEEGAEAEAYDGQEGEVYDEGAENAWGDEEEEIDFGMEPQPPLQAQEDEQFQQEQEYEQPQQSEEPLSGELEQSYEPEATAGADDWDLEDEDLFDEVDVEPAVHQEDHYEQEETNLPHLSPTDDNPNVVEEDNDETGEGGGNQWGIDDSFNFDDGVTEEATLAEQPAEIGTFGNDGSDEQQHQVDSVEQTLEGQHETLTDSVDDSALTSGANEWDESLNFDDDDLHEVPVVAETEGADETVEEVPSESHFGSPAEAEGEQDGAWKEDDLNLSSHHETSPGGEAEVGISEENDGWNSGDINSSGGLDTPAEPLDDGSQIADAYNKLSVVDQTEEEANQAESFDTFEAPSEQVEGSGWDNDDLNLSSNMDLPVADLGETETSDAVDAPLEQAEEGGWGNDDLNLSNHLELPGADEAEAETSGTVETPLEQLEEAGWDNNDLNLSNQLELPVADEAEAETSDAVDAPLEEAEEGGWGDGDLNLSSHLELPVAEAEAETPGTFETPLEQVEEAGWDNNDLNLSNHLELPVADEAEAETSGPVETPHEQVEEGGGWDNNDLNLSNHLELPVADEAEAEASDAVDAPLEQAEDAGWGDDDLNLSSHLEIPVAQAEAETSGTVETPHEQAEEGGWGDDDLNLSSHQELPIVDQAEAPTSLEPPPEPVEEGGWDNDDLNLSSHQELPTDDQVDAEASSTVDVPVEPAEDDGWDSSDLNLSSHLELPVPDQAAAEASGAVETLPEPSEEGGWGDDDMNLSSHQELQITESDVSDMVDAPLEPIDEGGWGNDDLNLISHHEHPIAEHDQAEASGIVETFSVPVEEDGWDNDDLNLSSHQGLPNADQEDTVEAAPETKEDGGWDNDDLNFSGQAEAEVSYAVGAPPEPVEEGAWDNDDLDLEEQEADVSGDDGRDAFVVDAKVGDRKARKEAGQDGGGGDDDSTVEFSNIGFEEVKIERQSAGDELISTELKFAVMGNNMSRRSTVRASNMRFVPTDSEDDDSENIMGNSSSDKHENVEENDRVIVDASPTKGTNEQSLGGADKNERQGSPVIRDNLSSVSGNSEEAPKPLPVFETQLSMMTLKSLADSCPSRLHENDSDEDDERGYLPVVDKTPELSTCPIPELSTMTINSTAVMAHSVNEDIQRDEDMEGTYYGGSTTGEGQSNDNVWEEDDASSLGGLHDLSEKLVNFELSTERMGTSTLREDKEAAPLPEVAQQATATQSAQPLDSSMAIVYTDDGSVPSRDEDDDNEDDFKPVVDQIPRPLKKGLSGRTLNSMAVLADGKQDGSTTNRESGGDDNAWDDGASLEGLDDDEPSASQQEVAAVVDNTPNEAGSTCGSKSGGSLAAVESVENSCPSRVHDSDEEQYGLVVDQIPTPPPSLIDQMSVAASSMAVVATNVEEELKHDEELDASYHGGSTIDELGTNDGWDDIKEELDVSENAHNDHAGTNADHREETEGAGPPEGGSLPETDRVVDLTPKIESKKLSRLSSTSLAVLAHSINLDFEDDNEDEEDDGHFGPIVDMTPAPTRLPAIASSSTATQGNTTRADLKQDETATFGVGDVNWDQECPELEDIVLGEEEENASESAPGEGDKKPSATIGQTSQNRVVLVDHTPENETPRKITNKGDASLAVLAPSEDGTCLSINDDDDVDGIDPSGERVSYGPVVDALPLPRSAPNTAPSVTFSLAVEARSIDDDFKFDDEMDETFCGDTTIEGAGGSVWDDQTLEDLDADQSRSRTPGSSSLRMHQTRKKDPPDPQVMVDHTPPPDTPQRPFGDASLVALAPSVASTYRTAGDSANDDDTITHDEDVYGKVVDHTPTKMSPHPFVTSNSMAVGASSADFRSDMERDDEIIDEDEDDLGDGWEGDDDALEGVDVAGPQETPVEPTADAVVDHTPIVEGHGMQARADPSVAVLAPSDDGSREEDDNDTYDGDQFFGHVVDHTPYVVFDKPVITTVEDSVYTNRPDGEMDATLFGDSTVGGGEDDANSGWDDDDAILDDLVDDNENLAAPAVESGSTSHASPHRESSSGAEVAASPSQDGLVMVDHTPSEIDSSAQKHSVGWLINVESGISGDDTTEDAGSSWRGGSTGAAQDARPEEDQVVDRIPQGPSSRFGDASTLVVADPSEVLSHVGDMLQEEQDFGPVVDVTPQSRPNTLIALSAAGSTAVVAPTVVHDDLDDGDPDDTVNAEENGWENDPSELEQAPNPQSGNEEETARVREQVVDFLPPAEEEATTDQNRDAGSEVATGMAPSVFQADPQEYEFGRKYNVPKCSSEIAVMSSSVCFLATFSLMLLAFSFAAVVDQLPVLHPSTPFAALSTASQVVSEECSELAEEDETESDSKQGRAANFVVDPLPRPFAVGMQNLDSTASLAQSLASEDETDDGRYGLVVDHLPSIRSSLPPSRGGSTVDALATVSEVIDDDGGDSSSEEGGNDGWGDDDDLGDIDVSDRPEALRSPRTAISDSESKEISDEQINSQAERGMTVRFRSVVAAIFESNGETVAQNDASASGEERAATSVNNQIFHDDVDAAADSNAWDDDLDFDLSLNMDSNRAYGNEISMLSSPERLAQFAEAETPPATPYSRLKVARSDTNGMPPDQVALPDLPASLPVSASMGCSTCANATTADCPCVQEILKKKADGDDSIKINYNRLLQTEISKRRLIEEESKDLRAELDMLRNSKSAGEVGMDTVETLQDHVQVVEGRLRDLGREYETLRTQNDEIQAALDNSRSSLLHWEERQKEWTDKETGLRQEFERTRQSLEASLSEVQSRQGSREQELLAEAKTKQASLDELSQKLGALQEECSKLRADNSLLSTDLQSFRQTLEERDEIIQKLRADEASYIANVKVLRDSVDQLELANSSSEELRQSYNVLKAELAQKDTTLDTLNNDMASLNQRVQAAEGEQYKQMKDHARISKQHEEELAAKQEELAAARKELEDTLLLLDQESHNAKWNVNEIQRLSSEKEALERQVHEVQAAGEQVSQDLISQMNQKEADLQVARFELTSFEEEYANLMSELERLGPVTQQLQHLEDQLHTVHTERDTLLNALNESNEKLAILQQQIDDQGMEEGAVEARKNQEIESLMAERTSLRNTISAKDRHIVALEQKLSRLADEKEILGNQVDGLKTSCDDLSASAESAKLAASSNEARQAELASRIDSLQYELQSVATERDEAQKARDMTAQRIEELEFSSASAAQQFEQDAGKILELEGLLAKAQDEIVFLRGRNDSITEERDHIATKCQELEQALASASQDSDGASRLLNENASLSNQIKTVQQEFNDQSIVLQNFEERMAALENELLSERHSNADKDAALGELKRELEVARANLEESAEGASMLPQRIAELEAMVCSGEARCKELEHTVSLYTSNEQEFQGILENATSERGRLAEENEEMLVQFGLLNEQLESYSEQLQGMQELVQRYESTSRVADARLLELQQQLVFAEKGRQENGDRHAPSTAGEDEAELNELREEQSKLIREIHELTNATTEKDEEIFAIHSELENVKAQLLELGDIKEYSDSMARNNDELRSHIGELESHRNELESTCTNQASEITRLQHDVDDAQNASYALESRVRLLEEACASRDQALQQKDSEIRELVERLNEDSGGSSESTQEILGLRDRINQMENSARESNSHMQEVVSNYERSQEELADTRGRLSSLETSVAQLEQQLHSKEEELRQRSQEHESALSLMENKLQEKAKEVAELKQENATFSSEVETVRLNLEAEQSRVQASDNTLNTEVESLRSQIASLQVQLETANKYNDEVQESHASAISELKRSIAKKDGEARMLKHKIQSLSKSRDDARSEVQMKQDELAKVISERDDLQKQHSSKAGSISASQLLQQTKENADDVDNLRSTVVSLASALEVSESRRADAIDRLLTERGTYADSLRRLSDSVKRFYHTVSGSEP